MALVNCSECGKEVSNNASACPNCGNPIDTTIRCPKCGSIKVKTISNSSKIISTALWGAFAANKVLSKYECTECRHKF